MDYEAAESILTASGFRGAFHYARESEVRFLVTGISGPPLEVDPNIPTEICLSILTNRFITPLPFTCVGNSEKDNTMRAILFG